jgi:GNAT superfamily N-acetyltransferase
MLLAAQRGATGWLGATDAGGRLVATSRVLADRAKWAWVYDVVVDPSLRGRGIGEALFRLLLDHPAVRDCLVVRLGTKDADRFYERFGFVRSDRWPRRPWTSIEMALFRGLLPHAQPFTPDRAPGSPRAA